MRHILSIASKELRGYFQSAVAVLFLATFLAVSLFLFFWIAKFFARNTADVRPLFDWLPVLLIFLVAALTMRLWSDEQKSGTIEVLLTLPVPVHRLVLGKFLAGLALVSLALALTLGLPITVSMMGNLDWGPVFGGYLAALLLASSYLAVGLCISSATDNQIVSLIGTVLVCGVLYLPGIEQIVSLLGADGGELLRSLGTGSRFESVARGVLDVRDLAYYASLTGTFLVLNVVLLHAKRWSTGPRWRAARRNARLAVALVALNAVALNLWLSAVTAARADLTEDNIYSLSEPTERLLAGLAEPLVLRGYFSEKTHPLLAPLVPQIRDMLQEYAVTGGSKVRVAVVDPSKNEQLEAEAYRDYGIKSLPFQFADRHERSVVNSFFHILVEYGDQHVVLSVDDLIEVDVIDIGRIDVRLDNFEYDITKSIRKVVSDFQSADALLAALPGRVQLTAFVTPDTLPENLAQVPEYLATVARELQTASGDRFSYSTSAPTTRADQEALYQQYGFKPFATSPLSQDVFYLHLLLQVGDRIARVPVPEAPSKDSVRDAIMAALQRATPGFTNVVGLVTPPPTPAPPPQHPSMPPQPPRPTQSFDSLRAALQETYDVRPVALDGPVPTDVDVLVLAGPHALTEAAREGIDQYLMSGGSVVALAGHYRLDLGSRDLAVEAVDNGLASLLEGYGVRVGNRLVMDPQGDAFPIPVERDLGGLRVQQIQRVPYPYFVRVGESGMTSGAAITGGLGPAIVHWASPLALVADASDGDVRAVTVTKLLQSSSDAWLGSSSNIAPDFRTHPDTGFGRPSNVADGDAGPHVLAVALAGTFDSAFRSSNDRDDALPDGGAAAATADGPTGANGAPRAPNRLIQRSTPDARLVVVGSSSFASDEVLGLSERAGSDEVVNNLQFVVNAIDWAVEDTDLLAIRARGGRTRTLDVPEGERGTWEVANYSIALFGLVLVVAIARVRRKASVRAASELFVPAATRAPQKR